MKRLWRWIGNTLAVGFGFWLGVVIIRTLGDLLNMG